VVKPPVEVPVPAVPAKATESANLALLPAAPKVELPLVTPLPPLPVDVSVPARATNENAPGERVALAKTKPIEAHTEAAALKRPARKALEGFIVQLAFNDKVKARRWAESMEKRGYAVSITEAGAEGALRVRLGNFAQRDDAERQLHNFKQEGLNGIIINLPQGFRPETRTSIP
jgi:DedD protein